MNLSRSVLLFILVSLATLALAGTLALNPPRFLEMRSAERDFSLDASRLRSRPPAREHKVASGNTYSRSNELSDWYAETNTLQKDPEGTEPEPLDEDWLIADTNPTMELPTPPGDPAATAAPPQP